ncbi:phosphotransferase family protein [Bacillus sp. 1P06AnD]|uniref:phosphotransferase family protein n=1 Tax=Bacillus sp. 1P06AnD TaxID=3132208 RepID=UPI00399F39ED
MTATVLFASGQLGDIKDGQIQNMLDQYGYGNLISFRKTSQGAMEQTLHIESSRGSFILKGNPLYPGQLAEEKFFIDQIAKRTNIPVPTPYIIDETKNIFEWSYSIMPCLPGSHLDSARIQESICGKDSIQLAELLAETLTILHSWKSEVFGEWDTTEGHVKPFSESYPDWLFSRVKHWLKDAEKYSVIKLEDYRWVEEMLESSRAVFTTFESPTFVMGDFKPGNFLVARDTRWKISGVFDFTNAYFADPLSDLAKMAIHYWDHQKGDEAAHFIQLYTRNNAIKENERIRLHIHLLHQRVLDWGCAHAIGAVTWEKQLSFSDWMKRYIDKTERLFV